MSRRLGQILSGVILVLLSSPGYALAFGPGWVTQGSYVHQTAHLLFAGAMFFFIHEVGRQELRKFRGFRYLRWAAWFFAIWNLDAIVGHFSEWALTNPVILGEGVSKRLVMESFDSWLFYVTQLNHFILLPPAFYLFYRGLKAFAREQGVGKP
jgi:hypothetical protein